MYWTSDTYGVGHCRCWFPVSGNRENLTLSLAFIGSVSVVVQGACYGASAAVASGGASCTPRGWWVIVYLRPDHLCNDWVILFVLHAETDAETAAEEAWCPPMPDAPDDPTESEIAGAADKLETMMRGSQPPVNIFFQPDNLGALPALWLQAKLTISLTSIQDKFAKLSMTIAAELWLRGRIDTLETVFQATARNFTIRLAEAIKEVFMLAE